MLVVESVTKTSAFYVDIFGFESGHGGDEYEQLLDHNGDMILQLHAHEDDDHHHGLMCENGKLVGNGVLVWFEVSDFQGTVDRAKKRAVKVETDVHENPNAKQLEFWFRDPDGYLVVAAGPSAYRTG